MSADAILDGTFIRRRRAELGLSARSVGANLGVTPSVVTRLEIGQNHQDISVGVVARLAEVLGVDVADLFLASTSRLRDAEADDIAALGSLLHQADVVTPRAVFRDVLGWSDERVRSTIEALDEQLRTVGMRLSRVANRYRIDRDVTAANDEELAALVRAHITREGLNLTEASMLACIREGNAPRDPSNPETVAIGSLVNARLVEPGAPPTRTSEMPLVLSEAVRFSLLLDEVDLGS